MWKAVTLIAALVSCPAIASAQQPCTPSAQRVVDAIYRQVLERPTDRASANLVERLSNGSTTVRDLVREVAKAPEHTQRFLSSTNRDEAVSYLYKHLLGRQADPEGLRGHAQAMAANGPNSVIDAFMNSAEYQQNFGEYVVPGSRVRFCGFGEDDDRPISSNRGREIRFQNMDRNNDGIIAQSEWRGNRESFVVHDWNGDGVLSGEEVRIGGRRNDDGRRNDQEDFDPVAQSRFNSWTEANFLNLDRNRDGRLTPNEWPNDVASFRAADQNRNGTLSMAEFTNTSVDDDRDARFTSLDTNRNGRVERNEWRGSEDAFEWLDRNNDNVLTQAEVAGNSGGPADRFANLDVNRDGRLTFNEWNWSSRTFDLLDTNQDEQITRNEFLAWSQSR